MNKLLLLLSLCSVIATAHDINTFAETKIGYDGKSEAITSVGTRINLNFGNIKGFTELAARDFKLSSKNLKLKDYTKLYSGLEVKEKIGSKLEFNGKLTTNFHNLGYSYNLDNELKYSFNNNLKLNVGTVLAGNAKHNEKTNKVDKNFHPELRVGFDYLKGPVKNYFDVAIKKENGQTYDEIYKTVGINYFIRNYKKNIPLKTKYRDRTILKDVVLDRSSEKRKYLYATYKLDNEFNYQKGKITFKNVTDIDYLNRNFIYSVISRPDAEKESAFLSAPSVDEAIKIPHEHEIKRVENTLTALNKTEFKYKYNDLISLNLLGETKTTIKKTGFIKNNKYHYWYLEDAENEVFSKKTYEQVNIENLKTDFQQYFKIEPQLQYTKQFNNRNSVVFTPSVPFEITYYNTKLANGIDITDNQKDSLQFKYINEVISGRKVRYQLSPKLSAKYTVAVNDNLSLVFEPEIQTVFSKVDVLDGMEKNLIPKLALKDSQANDFDTLTNEAKSSYRNNYIYFYGANSIRNKYLALTDEQLNEIKEKNQTVKKIETTEKNKVFSYDGARLKAKLSLIYKW